MSYQGYSPRPDGQQKAMKYCLIIAAATFALIFIVGIIAAIPRKTKEWREEKNQKAMYELFHKYNPFGFVGGNPLPLGGGRSLVNL